MAKGKGAGKGSSKGKKGGQKGKKDVQKTIQKKGGRSNNSDKAIKGDVEIDEDQRYTGIVVSFLKQRGFGFIKVDDLELPKGAENEVMVHWKDIKSSDRWPSLDKDMKVELNLVKNMKKDNSGCFLKAKDVSLPDGAEVCIQDASEEKLEYVGGDKTLRYTGKVIWYDWQKGFGFVKLEDGYDIPEDVPSEIRIQRQEIASGDDAGRLRKEMDVEFGISKNKGGKYNCYNLTLPGGEPVSRSFVEEREIIGDDVYQGTVKQYSFGQGWIEPEDKSALPADFQKKLKEFTAKRSKKSGKTLDEYLYFRVQDMEEAGKPDKEQSCSFKIYTDSYGVGACNVAMI